MPFRRHSSDARELARLQDDFHRLTSAGCEVIVVDGSPPPAFERHAMSWTDSCRHVSVDPRWGYLNGKVNGVLTGVSVALCEHIILADDDIVYSPADVGRMCALLDQHDMIVPQNYFRPLPWWASVETGRILLNRALRPAGDYPGTFGVRKSAFEQVGPYDGDLLFENEEMRRHFVRHGMRVHYARDFLIARRPPTFAKWREQRVRQAYEDLDARVKTAAFAALLPVGAVIATFGAVAVLAYAAVVSVVVVLLAVLGRRDGARRVVPMRACLLAPLWMLERSISVHRALWRRVRGGCEYGGRRILRRVGEPVES
jgi:hypothetical protein